MRNQGYTDLVTTTWTVLSGTAGLPRFIVEELNRDMRRIAVTPGASKCFKNEGEQRRLLSPETTVK